MRNKLIYIAILFLCFSALSGVAQESKEFRFYDYNSFGAKVGAVYSTIGLQPKIGDISPELSFNGGLVYIFSNKNNVGIQLEALYSQRKWRESFVDGSAITELSYLEIPFMTNIILGNGRFKYLINIGAYMSFLLDKKLKLNIPYENPYYQSLIDRTERKSDYGILVGGALRYISKVGIFQLDLRYAYGFQKLYNEDASGFRFSYMSGLSMGLIYTFNLKKDHE